MRAIESHRTHRPKSSSAIWQKSQIFIIIEFLLFPFYFFLFYCGIANVLLLRPLFQFLFMSTTFNNCRSSFLCCWIVCTRAHSRVLVIRVVCTQICHVINKRIAAAVQNVINSKCELLWQINSPRKKKTYCS